MDMRQVDIDDITSAGFVNKDLLNSALEKLKEIKLIVDELMDIRDSYIEIPGMFVAKINGFENSIRNFVQKITEEKPGSADQIARQKDGYLNNINEFYDASFNIDRGDNNHLLELYSILKSLTQKSTSSILTEQIKSFNERFVELTNSIAEKKESIIKNSAESETILTELKKKTAQETVSDYALVFKNEAHDASKAATAWLVVGISAYGRCCHRTVSVS